MKKELKFKDLDHEIKVSIIHATLFIEIEGDYNLLENWEILKIVEENLAKDPQGTNWNEFDFQHCITIIK